MSRLNRTGRESNSKWFGRAAKQIGLLAEDWTHVALLGGSHSLAFRLRVAQSHLRRDMLPSFWSDSALLVAGRTGGMARGRAIHVPLLQPDGREFAARNNGIVERSIADFDDPTDFPNVALIALPVEQDKVLAGVEHFRKSRSTLDALAHVLRWLGFAWGVERSPNPLLDQFGLPSSCMLETSFATASFDLTPGLESRASCPEAIWIAALHWHDYYTQFKARAPVGRFFAPHRFPIVEPNERRPRRR